MICPTDKCYIQYICVHTYTYTHDTYIGLTCIHVHVHTYIGLYTNKSEFELGLPEFGAFPSAILWSILLCSLLPFRCRRHTMCYLPFYLIRSRDLGPSFVPSSPGGSWKCSKRPLAVATDSRLPPIKMSRRQQHSAPPQQIDIMSRP